MTRTRTDTLAARRVRKVVTMVRLLLPILGDRQALVEDLSHPHGDGCECVFHLFFPVTFESNGAGCMRDWVKHVVWPLLSQDPVMSHEKRPVIDFSI